MKYIPKTFLTKEEIDYALEGLQRRINIINANHSKEIKKIYGSRKVYNRLARTR